MTLYLMKFSPFPLVLIVGLFLSSCNMMDDFEVSPVNQLHALLEDNGGLAAFRLPASDDFSAIPQDPNNPITRQKVKLGQLLFHETGIGTASMTTGGMKTFSCASCHFAGAGFQAGTFQGIGDGGLGFGFNGERRVVNPFVSMDSIDVQPIRTPTALNVAYQEAMLWNGQFGATGVNAGTQSAWTAGTPKAINFLGFEGVETQAIAGLGVHRLEMNPALAAELGYVNLFDLAFPEVPAPARYDKLYAALAIATFERTLLANQAPFQLWLKGNPNAMTMDEIRGGVLFFGKADCVSCHQGPALNSMSFHALGLADLVDCPEPTVRTSVNSVENRGRGGFTGNAEENFQFKVPQLYSMRGSPFYGHGASKRTLREVVEYKNNAIAENSRVPTVALSPEFRPLELTEAEIDDLTAFLTTGLHDARLRRYEPEGLPSGQCFPNHDEQTRLDIGCQ
jgi:cytochrome c peroxidase